MARATFDSAAAQAKTSRSGNAICAKAFSIASGSPANAPRRYTHLICKLALLVNISSSALESTSATTMARVPAVSSSSRRPIAGGAA